MKLNPLFLKHQMDSAALLVPTAGAAFNGIVQGNKTFEAILSCLEEDTTEQKIIDALCERFDGDREVIAEDVAGVLAKLKEIGAIDE